MPRRTFDTTEHRVYGPPGTGKTTWTIEQAARWAERFEWDQISICSLTNAAVREVAGRGLPIDEDNVTTLHARCKRALSAPGPAEDRSREFAAENPQWATEECIPAKILNRSKKKDSDEEEPETIDEVMIAGSRQMTHYEMAAINRNQMLPTKDWNPSTLAWYKVWKAWMDDQRIFDYTGWVEQALEIQPLPSQQIVFVDEAQDHSPLQLAVIRSWNCRKRVLIGDDDQNLYEWSGAIPSRFFYPDLPEGQELVLSQSWRIPKAVHKLAMSWVQQIRRRKAKEYRPREEEGKVIRSGDRLGDWEGNGFPRDFMKDPEKTYMILTSCGYMLDSVVKSLRDAGIAFHNPFRKSNKVWNPLDSPGERIKPFLVQGRMWTGEEMSKWAPALHAKGYQDGKKSWLAKQCEVYGPDPVPRDVVKEAFLPGVYQMVMQRDLKVFRDLRKAGMPGSWDYAVKVFSGDPEPEPRVVVGTIHSVKGGEADVVYLYPELSGAGMRDYVDYNRSDRVVRLFYVGMTRAKQELVLCEPDVNQWGRSKAVYWPY